MKQRTGFFDADGGRFVKRLAKVRSGHPILEGARRFAERPGHLMVVRAVHEHEDGEALGVGEGTKRFGARAVVTDEFRDFFVEDDLRFHCCCS